MRQEETFRILVVDDDPSSVEFIQTMLLREGYDVETAQTGTHAIEAAQAREFDLILCDLKLPDLDGTEVLARIKGHRPEAVVVILTGYASLNSAMKAIQRGAYDYIDKRSGGAQILHRVERALQFSRMQRELSMQRHNLELLTKFAYEINKSLSLEEVLATALPAFRSAADADAAAIYGFDEAQRKYILLAQRGLPHRALRLAKVGWRRLPVSPGVFHSLDDILKQSELSPKERRRWERFRQHFQSLIVQPLLFGEKNVGFVAACYSKAPERPRLTAELLGGMAHYLALALNNAQLHQKSERLLQSLKESEAKYRGLFENSREGVCLIANGQIRLANRALCEMLGYRPEEVLGQPFTVVTHPEDAPELLRRYIRRLRGYSEPARYETRLVRRNGETVDVECEVSVLELDGQRAIQVFVRDITERKRNLRMLQQRNRQLVALAEVARATNRSLDLRRVLTDGLRAAMRIVRAEMGKIYLLDEEMSELRLAATLGESGDWWNLSPIPLGKYFSGKAVATKRVVHITNSHAPEAVGVDGKLAEVDACSFLVVPLVHGNRAVGAMNLGRRTVGGFDKEEENIVRVIASTLALGIANSKAHQRVVEELRRLDLLHSHTYALAHAVGQDQVLRSLLEGAAKLSGAEGGFVALREGHGGLSYRVIAILRDGEVRVERDAETWSLPADLMSGLGVKPGIYSNLPDRLSEKLPVFAGHIRNYLVVPILQADEVGGILVLVNAEAGFSDVTLKAVRTLGHHAAAAMEKAELFDALRRSEQRFRQVFDLTPNAVMLLSPEGRILEINLHTLELLHATPTSVIGRELVSLLATQEDRGKVESRLRGAPEGAVSYEVEVRRADGRAVPVELRLVALPSGTSQPGWLALLHDLTRYKQYEAALKREKDFSERIIENAGVLIVGGTDGGDLIVCNQRVKELTGYTADDLSGGRWRQVFWPEDTEQRGSDGEWEKWITCKDGRRRCFRFTETELLDEHGTRVGAIGFGQDLTQLRNVQTQLVQTEKLAALGQLISGIAHEINNPLTGIMGHAQLLLSEDIGQETRKDLNIIYQEALRCKRIIGNLLKFARGEKPEKGPVDLNAVVRAVAELKGHMLKVDGIELELRLSPELPPVFGDETQLQQVVLNLVTNSHQAFKENQDEKRIVVETYEEHGEVVLRVEDNGPGIPDAIVDRIWDPFFTTKEVGKGTGLGLSVCYGIAEEHGGSIRLVQTSSEGTVFEVRLPALKLAKHGDHVQRASDTRESQQGPPVGHRVGKVLVVDDEAAVSSVLARVLSRLGYQAERVTDAREALTRIREKSYDLIFCDMKMPGMNGSEFIERLRAEHEDLVARTVIMTGDLLSAETEGFLKCFNGPVLKKPFLMEDIKALVGHFDRGESEAMG